MAMIIYGKKGLAFTLLSLFLIFIVFLLGSLFLFKGSYTGDSIFKEARVLNLNSDLKYFKNVYLKNSISYVGYNTFEALLNYSQSNYMFSKNYSKFQELFKEGLINGTFEGNNQPLIENNLTYFINNFEIIFNDNQKANFSYQLLDIVVLEKSPYHVTIEFLGHYNISTVDSIANWGFYDSSEVSFSIMGLNDPSFLLNTNYSLPITSAESIFGPIRNWTSITFNETITNMYSSVYIQDDFKYPLGSSFLTRLLNYSNGLFQGVLLDWNFDYDSEEFGVYDRSLRNDLGLNFGDTLLYYSFDNSTVNNLDIDDLSSYNITGKIFEANCFDESKYDLGCNFDGINDYIEISNEDLNLNFTNKFSISVWINPNSYNDNIFNSGSNIFNYGLDSSEFLALKLHTEGFFYFEVGSHNGGNYYNFTSGENVTLNEWNHLVATFDGDTGQGKLYHNGVLVDLDYASTILNFEKSSQNISLGDLFSQVESFNGKVDEISLYSKVLEGFEITEMYESTRGIFVNYKESLFEKSMFFDGIDDYSQLKNFSMQGNSYNQFSSSIWFKYKGNNSFNSSNQQLFEFDTLDTGVLNDDKVYLGGDFENEIDFIIWDSLGDSHEVSLIHDFDVDNWYNIVTTYDGNSQNFYLNAELVDSINWVGDFTVDGDLYLGKNSISNIDYFHGEIDEFKLFNRSLNIEDIKFMYYNYDSFGKACCNYLTLINSNALGYNVSPDFDSEISYSSKLFYDNYIHNKISNVTLFGLTQYSSNDTLENYYNFRLDICIMDAFNVFDYLVSFNEIIEGDDSVDCRNLVARGIY